LILDSTAVIDFLRDNQEARFRIKEMEEKNVIFATTAITSFELWQGNMNKKEEQKLREFLGTLVIFPFTEKDAQIAGTIHKALKRQGLDIQPEDSMIAGIAMAAQEPVLTKNIKHFERIPGLIIETY